MIPRKLSPVVINASRTFPGVTILGPRQSGKTTLVKAIFPNHTYINLENPETRRFFREDPKELLGHGSQPLIIDEAQREPEILSWIQVFIDKGQIPGQFIITGSNQPQLGEAISQSLAGRTGIYYLLPLSLEEMGSVPNQQDANQRDELLVRGCMPRLVVPEANNLRPAEFYQAYYATYVERDLRNLMEIKNLHGFDTFVRLLAGRVGQLVNLSSMANDVGVSSTTLGQWLNLLEASFIVFRLSPYYQNLGKRLVKTPKLYFTEPGLVAWLLQIETAEQVRRDPLIGNLFENWVVGEAFKAAYNRGVTPRFSFYRDSKGLEIDLIHEVERIPRALEIKSGTTFFPEMLQSLKNFRNLPHGNDIQTSLIYSGSEMFTITNTNVVPFTQIAQHLYP